MTTFVKIDSNNIVINGMVVEPEKIGRAHV